MLTIIAISSAVTFPRPEPAVTTAQRFNPAAMRAEPTCP